MPTPFYSLVVVNANYRGSLNKNIDLALLQSQIPNSKFCNKPRQLIIKDKDGIVLFFRNGKFRIMGYIEELDATFLAYIYTTLIDQEDCPAIHFQSMTAKVTLDKRLKLSMLHNLIPESQYEPELFPAMLVRKYKPTSVNIFSTGKIMICGVREVENIKSIMEDINTQLITSSVMI